MAQVKGTCLLTDEDFTEDDEVVAFSIFGGGYKKAGFIKRDALEEAMEDNDDLRNLILSDD